ncbi:MAG: prepilin peptidase [Planctomycetota bacterium]
MNWIAAIPLELQLAGLFTLGVCLGSLVNLCVYRLAWYPRAISPWSAAAAEAPPRRRLDRLPVVGWLGLRREAGVHGPGFWVRPMVVELLCGVGCAALYWWEIERQGLLPAGFRGPIAPAVLADLHAQFGCHVVLIGLMLAGSLIDVDERIIPDSITLPGTLFGLVAVAVYPAVLLPIDVDLLNRGIVDLHPLVMTSPGDWPGWLDGCPNAWSLVVGLGCWWLWCFALLPRTWYARRGWRRALELMCARLRRERSTRWILLMGLVGSAGIACVWRWGGLPGMHWRALVTSLVGMAGGGGIIWAIRVIGTAVLKREAMGFGDVTLMAMIGAMLGWQPCLIIFFLAPFAALLLGLVSLILGRGPEIPYGPFLCVAAVVVVVRWSAVWEWARPIFSLGAVVPLILLVCLVLMAGMLMLIRVVRTMVFE